jgi:hypothetical protein
VKNSKFEEDSFIFVGFKRLFRILESLSLGKAIEGSVHPRLEVYIVVWMFLEVCLVIASYFITFSQAALNVIFALFYYRLFEIFVTSMNSVIIWPMEKKRSRPIGRIFVLVVLNYLEVMVLFGFIFYSLLGQNSFMLGLNYSVSLATLSGVTIQTESQAIYAAGIVEMLLGAFFIAGVLSALFNYLGPRE